MGTSFRNVVLDTRKKSMVLRVMFIRAYVERQLTCTTLLPAGRRENLTGSTLLRFIDKFL